MVSLVLFLLMRSALMQDQWRLVYEDGSVESVWGVPQIAAEKQARLQYAWVWSELSAPRRVEVEGIGKQRFPDAPGRLEIRIVPPQGARASGGLRVIAAPSDMWRDLPEHLLPSWPVPASGRLAIPRDPGRAWRLRVAGANEGTWWVNVAPQQTTALLTPIRARGVRTLVTDAGGDPVEAVGGSILEGTARQGANRFWAALRGETGRLELAGLPDIAEVTLMVTKPGYTPTVLRGWPSELPDRLQLGTGTTLSGRLAAAGRKPIGGAVVEVESWASPQVTQLYRMTVRTKPDGTWTLAGIPPGPIFLSARAPGFSPFGQQLEVPPGTTDLGILTLTVGATVAVLATDEQGQPVRGARIEAGPVISAETNAQGLAKLAGVTPDAPLKLVANAAYHLAGKLHVNPPLPPQVQIELRRAFTVQGRFLEAPGVPAAGGLLRTEQPSCQNEGRLDAEGRFDWGLPPGEAVTLVLRSPRTGELRLPLAEGAPGEVRDLGDLLAPPGRAVTGRVVRTADDTSIAGARVWLPRPGPGGPLFAWAGRDVVETTTGEDGRFRLTGLPPGPALLRIDAGGFARAHLDLSLGESQGRQEERIVDVGDIRLAGGATLRVLVEESASSSDNTVARADLRGEWIEPDMLTAPVRNGEATLRNVPPGRVVVTVLAGRKLLCERQVDVPADTGVVDVDCIRAAVTVAGRVTVGGEPAGSGVLLWQPPPVSTASRIDNVVSPGGLRQQTIVGEGRPQVDVQVGPDGSFVTEDLTPGRWLVSWNPEAGTVSGSQTIDIPQVERFETVISYPGLVVTGRVVDGEGQPAEGARVREMTSGVLAFVGPEGNFTLSGLGGTKAVLQAQLDELSSPMVEVELKPDHPPESVLLTLGRRAASRIDLRVVGTDGSPTAGAFVFLEEEGKGTRILATGADGSVFVSLEPPLPGQVRVAATSGSAWALGDWLSTEHAREGILLELAGQGGLLVESDHHQGSPRLVSANGWDISWLLRLLGSPPFLSPDQPLRLVGLPAGSYSLSLEDLNVTVAVRAGVEVSARLHK